MTVKVGDRAPEFEAMDQNGQVRRLSDYKGKRVLLYFYPEDDTPGCTREACNFRDNLEALKDKVEVLGVSADSIESHVKFANKYSLNFPLLSDSEKGIISLYGANGLIFTKRSSFLISPEGVIEKIYDKVKPDVHAKQVIADLK